MSRSTPERGAEAGFLSRWSRRKQLAREGVEDAGEPDREPPLEAKAAVVAPAGPVEEVDEAALSDEELLARYELPDPAGLTASDDVAAFMRKGVPARLRSLALRRLWRLDPVLANLDGLNDYDDDYTDAAMLAGVVKTTYQVGRGGAAHLQDAADRLAAAEKAGSAPGRPEAAEQAPDGADGSGVADDGPADAGGDELREVDAHGNVIPGAGDALPPAEIPQAAAGSPAEPAKPAPPPEPARRRRMVFATPDAADLHTGSSQNDN